MADEREKESEGFLPKVQRYSKLVLILVCWALLFAVVVLKALWFIGWPVDGTPIGILDWIKCLPNCQLSWDRVLKCLGNNVLLCALFVVQHTFLAERKLKETWFHQKFFIDWKVNGALYTLTTGIALYVLLKNWIVVPIYIWNFPAIESICTVIHVVSWFSLYGTMLMQDMPELIGLHQQVVFTNVSTSRKSSEFKSMLNKQRHLGLIPFTALISACPIMTLDRFLFLVFVLTYSYAMWRDPESFEYIREMSTRKRTRLSGVDGRED
ncbi:Nurim [Orchesella cincta]|uniref:Nuclear envelope membrane protein n=1 Tax=Orchesella cincta TaxID=48709 RepID=A0A1D2N9I9_ORCCI|nr:Nurim [Orchesella cincta]